MTQHTSQLHTRPGRPSLGLTFRLLLPVIGVSLLMGALPLAQAAQSVAMRVGDSRVMQFNNMKRVWVVDPQVLDVVISSANELLLHAKGDGQTALHVWDKSGHSEFSVTVRKQPAAEKLSLELRRLLGTRISYKVLGENTLLIEGEVDRESEREQFRKIIQARADGVDIVDLIIVKDEQLTPAERSAKSLREVLGDKFNYLLWDDKTVIITGPVDTKEELERVQSIIAAANEGKPFASAVVLGREGSGEAPVAQIARAVGPQYRVWPLKGNIVVVEGEAEDQIAKQRVDTLLTAFAPDTQVVNLTRVTDQPKVPVAAQRDILAAALGSTGTIQVSTVSDRALLLEGTVPDEGALTAARAIIEQFKDRTAIIDNIRIAAPNKRQILAHVKVMEVTKGALDRHGVHWGQLQETTSSSGATTFVVADQPFLVRAEGGVDNLFDFGALVEALQQDDDAQLLANPDLLVNDGEEATMLSGGELPIPTPQIQGGAATVGITYKEYGVRLRIKPTIRPKAAGTTLEHIEMQITPEVSSIDTATSVSIGGISVPGFRTQRATTIVDLVPGQVLSITNLVANDQSRTIDKIPLLGDIPVIGELFRHTAFRKGKTELIILVTPEIIEPKTN